jgi:hypothetical protein
VTEFAAGAAAWGDGRAATGAGPSSRVPYLCPIRLAAFPHSYSPDRAVLAAACCLPQRLYAPPPLNTHVPTTRCPCPWHEATDDAALRSWLRGFGERFKWQMCPLGGLGLNPDNQIVAATYAALYETSPPLERNATWLAAARAEYDAQISSKQLHSFAWVDTLFMCGGEGCLPALAVLTPSQEGSGRATRQKYLVSITEGLPRVGRPQMQSGHRLSACPSPSRSMNTLARLAEITGDDAYYEFM